MKDIELHFTFEKDEGRYEYSNEEGRCCKKDGERLQKFDCRRDCKYMIM